MTTRALFIHPQLDASAVVAALRSAGFDVGSPEPLTRTAFDTFDGRLHAAGLRLELQRGHDSALVLRERAGDGPEATIRVDGDVPQFGDGLPAGPFRQRVATVTRERALLPLVTTTARRSTAARRDRRGKVVVTVDVYDALDPDVGAAVATEVVGVRGHQGPADDVAAVLHDLSLELVDGDLVDLAAARAGVDLAGRQRSPTVDLEPSMPALVAFARVLRNLADAIEENVDGTAADIDSEFLHDLRVAVRRTRSVLSQGRGGVLPDDARLRRKATFDWLAQVTGPARDLDVYLLEWDDYVEPLGRDVAADLGPVRAELERRRHTAHVGVTNALRSARFHDAMRDWRGWLDQLSAVSANEGAHGGPEWPKAGLVVARRIAKAQRRVLRDGRAITPTSPAEALHELRKDAKKLRYLLECFGGLLAAKRLKSFTRRLKALQDNLGAHQDAEVHTTMLATLGAELHARGDVAPAALMAVGRLVEQLEQRCVAARAEFAERFASYDTSTTRRELDALIEPLRDA